MRPIIMSLFTTLFGLLSCSGQTDKYMSVEVEEFAKVIEDTSVVRLDVRTSEEYAEGHIDGAINIDVLKSDFEQKATSVLPKDKTIALYCRSGRRSKRAAEILSSKGYTIVELNTGYNGWKGAGKEIVTSIDKRKANMKSFGAKAWMLPQPVLIIGTYNENGVANAMNAAWGGQWDMHEIIISMGSHQTTDNLKLNNGEFTVAFATKETATAADFVGIVSAKNDPEKMQKTGWKFEKAPNVNAPVFDVFPMTLECRIKEKIDESETGYYLVAEIVNIICKEEYLAKDGKPSVEEMNLITFDPIHMGYIQLGERVGNAFADGKKLK